MSYNVSIKTRVDIDENKDYVFNKYVVATVDFSLDQQHPTYNGNEFQLALDEVISKWDEYEKVVQGALIETSFRS